MPATPCTWHKPRKTNISTPNTCQGRYLGEEMLVALRSKSTSPSPTSPSSVSAHASSDESVSDSSGRFSSSTFQAPIPWSVPEPPPSDFTPLFTEDSEIKPIVLNLNAATAPTRHLESIFKDLDLAEGTPLASAAAAAAADGEGQRLTAGFGINSPEKNVDTARETDKKKKPAHRPVDHASAASGHYPGNGANRLNRNEEKEATSSKKPVRGGVQANKISSQNPHDGTSISKRTHALPNSTTPATGILKHAQDKKQTTPHTRAPSHGTSSSSRVPQSTSMPKRSPTPARREPRLPSSVAQHRTPSLSAQHRHWMTDLGSSSVPSAAVTRGRNNTPPCKSAGEQGTKGTSTSTLTSTTHHPASARGILKNTQQSQSISSAKEAGAAYGSNSSCRAHSRGPSPAANRPLPQGSSSRGTSAAPAPKPLASSSIITSTRAPTPKRRKPAPLSSSLITSSNNDVSSSNKVDEKLSSRGKSGAAGTTVARSGTPRAPSRTRSHSEASTMKTGKQTPSRNTSTTRTPWSANTSTEGLSFTMSKSSTGREPAGERRALHHSAASCAAPATRGVKPQTTRRTPSSSCVNRTTKEIDLSVGRTANNEVVVGDRSISRTPRRVVPPCVAENQGKTKQGGGADTGARMRSGTPKAQGAAADALSRSLQRATASSRSGATGSGYGSSRSPVVRRKKLEEIKNKAAETLYMAKGSTVSPRGLKYAPPPSTDNAAKCGSTAVVTNALVQSLMEAQKACTPRASEAWKERIRSSNTPSNSVHTPRYPRSREEDAAHHATTTGDGQIGEKNSPRHNTQRGVLEERRDLKKNGSSTISDTNKEAPISIKVNPASPGNALNVDDLCRRLSLMSIRSNSSVEDDARDPEHTPECPQMKSKGKLKKGGLMCLKIDTSDISHIDGQATTREEERILMSDERKESGSMIVHDARAATVDVVVDHKEKIHTKRSKEEQARNNDVYGGDEKKMEAAPVTTPSFACSSPDEPSPRSPIIIKPVPNTQVLVAGRGAPEHSPHPGSSSNTLKTLKAARSERRFGQRSAAPGNSPPIPSSRGTPRAPAQAQSPLQPGGTVAEASSVTTLRPPPHARTPSRGSRRGEGKKKMEQKTLHNKDTPVNNDLSDLLSPSLATYSCATPSDRLASPSLRGEAANGVNSSDINKSKVSKLHNLDQEQLIALRQCIDTLIRGEDLTSHIHLHELDRQRLNELKLLFGTKIDLDDDVRKERDWFYEKYVQTVDICRYIHDNTSNDRIPEAWGRLLAHLRSFSEE